LKLFGVWSYNVLSPLYQILMGVNVWREPAHESNANPFRHAIPILKTEVTIRPENRI